MGALFDDIRMAVRQGRWLASWHADERCEEREIATWQVVAELEHAELILERRDTSPNPTVVVREVLVGGRAVEVVWAWLAESRRAKLVTVYFPE